MSLHRSLIMFAALAVTLGLSAGFGAGSAEARLAARGATRGVPPFCVVIRGPRGWDYPQICEFYNYQQCLEAAIGPRTNCVVNIDFPGEVKRLPNGDVIAVPRGGGGRGR